MPLPITHLKPILCYCAATAKEVQDHFTLQVAAAMNVDLTKDIQDNKMELASSSVADVICEFLEVAFHLVLYNRGIYPDGIFKKRQKYNISVMMSCHPDLNSYINDVLVGIKLLITKGNVERVTLQVVSNENVPIEKYVFELLLFMDRDRNRVIESVSPSLEQQLRDLLLKIHTADAVLKPLPNECSFTVSIQTKESVANELVNGEQFEGFPWAKSDEKDAASCFENPGILPLKSCSTQKFDLQCFVETNISTNH